MRAHKAEQGTQTEFWLRSPTKRDHLGDVGVNWR